jgi:hypothetical protein
MPPADAAPDPLDRPAEALAAALAAWCATKSPPDAGAWLPALPFSEWFDWQQDLARRLAAAVLAAVLAAAADRPAAGKCPRCRGNTIVPVIDWRLPRPITGYQPCPNCRGTGKVNDAGGRS